MDQCRPEFLCENSSHTFTSHIVIWAIVNLKNIVYSIFKLCELWNPHCLQVMKRQLTPQSHNGAKRRLSTKEKWWKPVTLFLYKICTIMYDSWFKSHLCLMECHFLLSTMGSSSSRVYYKVKGVWSLSHRLWTTGSTPHLAAPDLWVWGRWEGNLSTMWALLSKSTATSPQQFRYVS